MSNQITEITEAHKTTLDKAKIALMSTKNTAFFTTILFSMKFVWDAMQPTAWTDGMTIGMSPSFWMSMDEKERVGVLLHEVLHVAYMHPLRLMGRKHKLFNYACDYVINLQIVERGFSLPGFALLDKRFANMSAEQVYDILLAEEQTKPQPDLGMADLREPGAGSEGGKTGPEIQQHIENILIRAQVQSKMSGDAPGTVPGDIELFLNRLLDPKLPWQTILRRYVTNMSKNDYSWRKPNRRFFPDHYLPSLYSETLMDLVFAVDISGSVTDEMFTTYVSEIANVFKMMKPKKITLIQFDTKIQHIDTVTSIMELCKIKFSGRGGTMIEPVMEWAKENKPQLLLVFSDGEFNFHHHGYKTNTLFLVHDNPGFKPAYGKAIHFEI